MWQTVLGFFSVVLIDLVLSGDNALVIGMACANLPAQQRRKGVLYGSLAAVVLRVLLAAAAAMLLRIPLLRAAGGLLLLWIAYKLGRPPSDGGHDVKPGATLAEAVRTIALADLVMSLDNVLAVGGVSGGNLALLLFGLGLTIPIIMWGSGFVARLLCRLPWLGQVGAAVLAWTAGGMIAADPLVRAPAGPVLPAAATVLVLGCAAWDRLRV